MYKIILRYIYVLLFLGSSHILFAQCSPTVISQARQSYEVGQLDKVIEQLEGCLNSKALNLNQKVDALYIIALTYIGLDKFVEAEKYVKTLLELDPTFVARTEDPVVFQALVYKGKLGQLGTNVSSVSKVNERLEEAPATVILITEEEIKQRGYIDLEMLLHDLPGFDISQSNGITYSSIYQRGYRSINTDRMLLLVDGVEDNDLWGNIVYLSRQYAMSNISSVEVIYGPSSTIYGPNAFVGVISINTKRPVEYLDDNKNVGATIEAGYGQWNTRYVDATVAARIPNQPIELSLTGRYYYSDEPNFQNDEKGWFNYELPSFNQSTIDDFNNGLGIFDSSSDAKDFLNSVPANSSQFFEAIIENGDTTGVQMTDAGVQEALNRDAALLNGASFKDLTKAWSASGKLNIYDLTIGFQYWQKREGIGSWFNDVRQGTAAQGQSWNPNSTMFYVKYNKDVSSRLSIKAFTRYKTHGYLADNALVTLNSYSNNRLDMSDLANGNETNWDSSYLMVISNQVRSELTAIYRFNSSWNFFTGLETRFSAIQANYITSDEADPEENGFPEEIEGGNHFFSRDVGVYAQTNYLFSEKLKVTAGLRYDNNRIRTSGGYGGQFSPRFAVIYQPNDWVFKAIYAQAHKAPTNSNYYSTVSGQRELSNPDSLKNEEVANVEISVRRIFSKNFNIEAVAYRAAYSQTLEEASVPNWKTPDPSDTTNQFQSLGASRVWGGHIMAIYNKGSFSAYGNYTYTLPYNLAQDENGQDSLTRIGDISAHQINLGGNYKYRAFNFNLRTNIVGARKTGPTTTVTGNLDTFDPYAIFNGTVTYRLSVIDLYVDFMVNNIFNTQYYSPGVRAADNKRFSSSLPQKGRYFNLRVRYTL